MSGDALLTRSLVADLMEAPPRLSELPKPVSDDPTEISLAAALVEVFAAKLGQPPPEWAAQIGRVPQPVHLLTSTATMRRLRESCEADSPLPLRRRNFFAPANYLEMV